MSMQDPIADMLTIIRNGQQAGHSIVKLTASNMKLGVLDVLKEEGFISDYAVESHANNSRTVTVALKYFKGQPVIDRIKRLSRPGLRVYKSAKQLMPVAGFGITILSTSRGIMSHLKAKALGVGGELICEVA